MKYRKLWEMLMKRAMELADGGESWIGERIMQEMDGVEYEYHEELVMQDLANGLDRMKTQEGEKE